LNPADRGAGGQVKKEFVAAKSPAVLQAELDTANARIAELVARLEAAGLSTE
jgi:hypothetical protein